MNRRERITPWTRCKLKSFTRASLPEPMGDLGYPGTTKPCWDDQQ